MKAAVTLKENYEFRRTYQKGVTAVSPVMVLYCRKNRLGRNRLGLVSSTKLGHAVVPPPSPGGLPSGKAPAENGI